MAKFNAELDVLIKPGKKSKDKVKDKTKSLLESLSPNIWNTNIPGNKEVEFETSFAQLLISVCSDLQLDSNKLTTFDFYNAVELLEKRHAKK